MDFLPVSNKFHIIMIRKGSFCFGTFGLGQKCHQCTVIVNLRQRGKSNHSLHTCEKFLLEVFSYPKMCVGLVSFFPAWLFDRSPIWHSTNGIFMEITCQSIWISKPYFMATAIRCYRTPRRCKMMITFEKSLWLYYSAHGQKCKTTLESNWWCKLWSSFVWFAG